MFDKELCLSVLYSYKTKLGQMFDKYLSKMGLLFSAHPALGKIFTCLPDIWLELQFEVKETPCLFEQIFYIKQSKNIFSDDFLIPGGGEARG